MKTMNKYMLGLAFVSTMAMMTACSDDNNTPQDPVDPVEPSFEMVSSDAVGDPPTFSFTSAGNTVKLLSFNTNQNWRVELVDDQEGANYDWLTLYDREGMGGAELQRVWIAAAENTGYDDRRAEFKLIVPNGDKDSIQTFTVYQAQKDAILVTDPKAFMNLSSDENILPLEFQYNIDEYEISVSKPWMEVTDEAPNQTRALRTDTKYVKVAANNDSFNARSGTITIKDKNSSNTSATVVVTQYGLAKPTIYVNNADEFASVPNTGGAINLDLSTTNVTSVCDQLTIDVPDNAKDWLSFVKNEDETGYIVKVKENDGGARSASLTICPKIDHTRQTYLTVKQASADGVTVSITNKFAFGSNLSKLGGNFVVKYSTQEKNWEYAIETPEGEPVDWVHVTDMATPKQMEVSYDANPSLKSRTAIFKVFPAGNKDKADKITLIQNPKTQIEINGGLQKTLDQLVTDGIYSSVKAITSLELKGALTRNEMNLLATMLKGNGYKLNTIDLSEVTLENDKMVANQFNGCTQLQSIVFPKSMRVMEERVCQGCTNLTSAKFNEGITYICNHAFNNCTNLTKVWIPSTVSYIYGSVFEKCTSLAEIHLQCLPLQRINVGRSPSQPQSKAEPFFNAGDVKKNATLYVPTDYVEYYKNPDPQHVASLYLKDYLSTLTASSKEWVSGGVSVNMDWHPSTNALRSDFSWSNGKDTKIIAEDSWE